MCMSRKSKVPDERKNEFIAVAEKLFLEKGYEQTTIADIVQHMEVAHGLFYYYFKSKEDIIKAITQNMFVEAETRLRSLVNNKNLDVIEKLRIFIQEMAKLKMEKLYVVTYVLDEKNTLLVHMSLKLFIANLAPLFAELIEQGVKTNVFDTPSPKHASEFLFTGMFFLFFSNNAIDSRADWFESIMAIADVWERVLGAPKGSIASIYQEISTTAEHMVSEIFKGKTNNINKQGDGGAT